MRNLLLLLAIFPLTSTAVPDCKTDLLTTPIAISAPEKLPDGRWRYFVDYTTRVPGQRQIELPAVMNELVGIQNLRVVVLAGNSGSAYENTRHSLAHGFADYLVRHLNVRLHSTDPNFSSLESVMVSYDDDSVREWTYDFKTEKARYRTDNTEIFFAPSMEGVPVIFVRVIGDYNEIGDVAIAILDMLKLPPANLLLVHDDLKKREGDIELVGGPQEYNGNNAGFSLLRNLTYGLFEPLLAELKNSFGLDEQETQAIMTAWRDKANIRDGRYMNDPKAFKNHAFRNVDFISVGMSNNDAVKTAVIEKQAQPLRQKITNLREEIRRIKEGSPLMAKLKGNDTPKERRKELSAELSKLTKPLEEQAQALEAQVKGLGKAFADSIRPRIVDRITYTRLGLGTDDGKIDPNDLPGFVLAAYPQDVFNDAFWERTLNELKVWIRQPAVPVDSE